MKRGLIVGRIYRQKLTLSPSIVVQTFGVIDSFDDSYLVDPASRHMLVMRTKPCMSKYKLLSLFSETANGSLNQL